MIPITRASAFGFCVSALFLIPQVAEGSPRKPKGTVLCLPPGSGTPKPCAALTAQSSLAFRADSDYQGTAILRFRSRPVDLEATVVDVPLSRASLRGGQIYTIQAPLRQMCSSSRSGQRLQFEIQILTSDMQQSPAAGDADSVGFFQMRC